MCLTLIVVFCTCWMYTRHSAPNEQRGTDSCPDGMDGAGFPPSGPIRGPTEAADEPPVLYMTAWEMGHQQSQEGTTYPLPPGNRTLTCSTGHSDGTREVQIREITKSGVNPYWVYGQKGPERILASVQPPRVHHILRQTRLGEPQQGRDLQTPTPPCTCTATNQQHVAVRGTLEESARS